MSEPEARPGPSLADCAREWLATGATTDPEAVFMWASRWTLASWVVVARRFGFPHAVKAEDVRRAIDELRVTA